MTMAKQKKNLKKDLSLLKKQPQRVIKKAISSNVLDFNLLARQAKRGMHKWVKNTGEQLTDVKDTCEGTIKHYPFIATASAFIAGALVASLFNRKY